VASLSWDLRFVVLSWAIFHFGGLQGPGTDSLRYQKLEPVSSTLEAFFLDWLIAFHHMTFTCW
jgi:hypothetical protein